MCVSACADLDKKMLNEVKAELKSFYFVEGCATPIKLQKLLMCVCLHQEVV